MSRYNQNASIAKPANKAAPQKKKSGGGALMGLFAGLVLGVLIAFGVVLYLNKSPLPFQDKFEGAPKKDAKPAAPVDPAAPPGTPASLPGKPGDKPVDAKRRFEFYGILEGKQPAVPQAGVPASAPPATPATTPTTPSPAPTATETKPTPGEIYFLQAGSFQKAKDADNLKAKLALSGLDVNVQEVTVPDKGTMHRVRVGPFKTLDEMNQARNALSQNGVQATVVKQKE